MPAFTPALRAAVILLITLILTSLVHAQVSLPIEDEEAAVSEARIETALAQNVSFSFAEEPLKDAIDTLRHKTGLSIVLATKKLEEAAINLETPVTISLNNITLASFLRNFLGELGLTFIVKDEVIQITTPEDAGSQLLTRIYPVLDLVSRRTSVYEANAVVTSRNAGGRMGVADYESLMNVITSTIDPDSWDDVGGPGSIAEFDNAGVLIISQTREVHQKIGPLLNSLRRVKGLQGLPTIAPPARTSSPVLSTHGSEPSVKDAAVTAASNTPARRRIAPPRHSWQLPQVYEE